MFYLQKKPIEPYWYHPEVISTDSAVVALMELSAIMFGYVIMQTYYNAIWVNMDYSQVITRNHTQQIQAFFGPNQVFVESKTYFFKTFMTDILMQHLDTNLRTSRIQVRSVAGITRHVQTLEQLLANGGLSPFHITSKTYSKKNPLLLVNNTSPTDNLLSRLNIIEFYVYGRKHTK